MPQKSEKVISYTVKEKMVDFVKLDSNQSFFNWDANENTFWNLATFDYGQFIMPPRPSIWIWDEKEIYRLNFSHLYLRPGLQTRSIDCVGFLLKNKKGQMSSSIF